jgi:hypothetical protein
LDQESSPKEAVAEQKAVWNVLLLTAESPVVLVESKNINSAVS